MFTIGVVSEQACLNVGNVSGRGIEIEKTRSRTSFYYGTDTLLYCMVFKIPFKGCFILLRYSKVTEFMCVDVAM